MGFALEEQKKGHPNHRAVDEKRATKGRLHCFGVTKQHLHCGKVDVLRSGGQKKVIPGLWQDNREKEAMKEDLHCVESHAAKAALFFWGSRIWGSTGPGEDGEKKAMKENLHCVESHEAESALFFGGLESGGLQGPRHRFRIWKSTYLFLRSVI